jgi:hypothetical protein
MSDHLPYNQIVPLNNTLHIMVNRVISDYSITLTSLMLLALLINSVNMQVIVGRILSSWLFCKGFI